MVGNAQALVALFGLSELRYIQHQVFLFTWLQDHRVQQSWSIAFHIVPTVIVNVQIRLHTLSLDVATHHVVHESLQKRAFSSQCPEGERLDPSRGSLPYVLRAREPDLKRPSGIPEPMAP